MSECKRENCEEEAACSYNNDYCSSTCEIMHLRSQLKHRYKMHDCQNELKTHIMERNYNLEQQLKASQEEAAALSKFINGIISQTSTKMQNYMVQAVYDQMNTKCRDFMKREQEAKK